MVKLEAPKAKAKPSAAAEAQSNKKEDALLELVRAANPNSRVYRNMFGCIVTEHGVKA